MTDKLQLLQNRVYLAAKDGIAITLYTLLCDLTKEEACDLLDQVKRAASTTTHFSVAFFVRRPTTSRCFPEFGS